MKEYRIKVIADQKHESVETAKDGRLFVSVKAKREEGKANVRAKQVLAKFLGIHEEDIVIIKGHTQATKTIRLRSFINSQNMVVREP